MLEKMAARLSGYQVRMKAYVLMSCLFRLIASTPRGNPSCEGIGT